MSSVKAKDQDDGSIKLQSSDLKNIFENGNSGKVAGKAPVNVIKKNYFASTKSIQKKSERKKNADLSDMNQLDLRGSRLVSQSRVISKYKNSTDDN